MLASYSDIFAQLKEWIEGVMPPATPRNIMVETLAYVQVLCEQHGIPFQEVLEESKEIHLAILNREVEGTLMKDPEEGE